MIVFYLASGEITGYQTYPPVYKGDWPNLTVPDNTDLTGKIVIDGKLIEGTVESNQAANNAAIDDNG